MNELDYLDLLSGKTYPAWMVAAVDDLLMKVRKQNIWKIVDFCIAVWSKKYPKEHKRYLKEMANYRKNRLKETAATKSNVMRELVIAPREVVYLLEKIAYDKIEDYGRLKFWREFARRHPGFSPAKKL